MREREPTILATSGGFVAAKRTTLQPGPLVWQAIELAAPRGRPRLCCLGTAGGDQRIWSANVHEAFYETPVEVTCLHLLPMPNFADLRAHLLAQDVIWVNGGSVAGLLALWRLHGLDRIFCDAWQAGVVLGGVSAGSLCWHVGGTTDSFGPDLRPVTDALGLLPYSNCPHYDTESQRRPLYQRLIAEGLLPAGYATDDGVGLLYRDKELVEAVTAVPGKAAYFVERSSRGTAQETRIEPRLLQGG